MAQQEFESPSALPGQAKRRPKEPIAVRGSEFTGNRALRGVVIASLSGLILLWAPIARTGIWDPVELRIADLAARVSSTLFHAKLGTAVTSPPMSLPTLGELGRGELPYTSIALGFKLFGLHDWAGRLPLILWTVVALVAMVAWLRKYGGSRAAAWAALVFPTLPILFLQARFMLGDATTMACQFACFASLCVACLDGPSGVRVPIRTRWLWLCVALVAGVLGVLSRGLLIGVAVPFLAVGLAGLTFESKKASVDGGKVRSVAALSIGTIALAIAVSAAMRTGSIRGIWLLLRGANYQADYHPHSFDVAIAQLGHGLFPWSGFALFALILAFFEIQKSTTKRQTAQALVALCALVFLTVAAQSWLGGFGVTMPFPGIVALVALMGIAL